MDSYQKNIRILGAGFPGPRLPRVPGTRDTGTLLVLSFAKAYVYGTKFSTGVVLW